MGDTEVARAARSLVVKAKRHRKTWTSPEGKALLAAVDEEETCALCGQPRDATKFCSINCAELWEQGARP